MKNPKSNLTNNIFGVGFLLVILTITTCKYKLEPSVSESVSNLSGNADIQMVLTNIFIVDKTLYNSEGNNILIKIQVRNNSDKEFLIGSTEYYLNSGESEGTLKAPNIKYPSSKTSSQRLSGFYFISNEFQPGAIKLNSSINGVNTIEAKHTEYLTIWSNCVYISYFLKRTLPKENEKAYKSVLDFFTKSSYSLIYISSNDSRAYLIQKSEKFKVVITNSLTDELRKLGEK